MALTTVTSGMGGGVVKQIVYTSNATEAETTGTSYANTAHTVTITPAASANKILVGVSFAAGVELDSGTEASVLFKLRNTTDSADLNEVTLQINGASGALRSYASQTLIGVDTGRTGAPVYYLQVKSANSSTTAKVNEGADLGFMWAIELE